MLNSVAGLDLSRHHDPAVRPRRRQRLGSVQSDYTRLVPGAKIGEGLTGTHAERTPLAQVLLTARTIPLPANDDSDIDQDTSQTEAGDQPHPDVYRRDQALTGTRRAATTMPSQQKTMRRGICIGFERPLWWS
jgi:hypothetical protein